jgi:hypothetical protein
LDITINLEAGALKAFTISPYPILNEILQEKTGWTKKGVDHE